MYMKAEVTPQSYHTHTHTRTHTHMHTHTHTHTYTHTYTHIHTHTHTHTHIHTLCSRCRVPYVCSIPDLQAILIDNI